MAYFTPGLPTRIVTDASPIGLGAILEQKNRVTESIDGCIMRVVN